jgi:hypothetical protein
LALPPRTGFGRTKTVREILISVAVLAMAWGMVYYYAGVLGPIRGNPGFGARGIGGYQSDLYPRWLGARDLLLYHRNPYSQEVTEEIERGFYGRPIDPSRDAGVDPEAFAYPVYVTFLLAPLLPFRFETVQPIFTAVLVLLTAGTLPLWIRGMRLDLGVRARLLGFAAMMSSYAVIEGLCLGQITLLVSFLMAGSVAALSSGSPVLAGVLMALTLVKPQLSCLLVAFLIVWVAGDWRARKGFAIGFGIVVALLLAGSEVILPGWFGFWREAVGGYIRWHRGSLMTQLLGARVAAAVAGSLMLLCGVVFWRCRTAAAGSSRFNFALVSALSVTLLVLPNAGGGSFYNEILLVPVVLWLFASGTDLAGKFGPARVTWMVAVAGLVGQWILAFAVSFAAFVLGYRFHHEATPFVGGPELLMYCFPAELALFVWCASPQFWRGHE